MYESSCPQSATNSFFFLRALFSTKEVLDLIYHVFSSSLSYFSLTNNPAYQKSCLFVQASYVFY